MSKRRGSKRRKKPLLTIDLIPPNSWGVNCRTEDVLPKAVWDKARRRCYREAGYLCEVCGGRGPAHPVECHERWKFNRRTREQTLVGFIALCPKCHEVTHYGRTYHLHRKGVAAHRLQEINGWDSWTTCDYIQETFDEYEKRREVKWNVRVEYAYEYTDSEKELGSISRWLKGDK